MALLHESNLHHVLNRPQQAAAEPGELQQSVYDIEHCSLVVGQYAFYLQVQLSYQAIALPRELLLLNLYYALAELGVHSATLLTTSPHEFTDTDFIAVLMLFLCR